MWTEEAVEGQLARSLCVHKNTRAAVYPVTSVCMYNLGVVGPKAASGERTQSALQVLLNSLNLNIMPLAGKGRGLGCPRRGGASP